MSTGSVEYRSGEGINPASDTSNVQKNIVAERMLGLPKD